MWDGHTHTHAVLQREHVQLGRVVSVECLRRPGQMRAQHDGVADGQLFRLRQQTSDTDLLPDDVHVRSLD